MNNNNDQRPWIITNFKEKNISLAGFDIYQFGIRQGGSFKLIWDLLVAAKLNPNKVWGFDSFEGLPESEADWTKGIYNAQEILKLSNTTEVVNHILSTITPEQRKRSELIVGFYKDVLTSNLVVGKNMKPAIWIDIDVDLYSSAKEVLNFMASNKLIKKGTIIGYDDWGGTEEFKGGESLAHLEFCEEWKVTCKKIHTRHNKANPIHITHAFQVTNIEKLT
ncbi:hypothetical protein LCGC14_1959350 [marine sediment metagenome]|uniref:Macrocin O-methyltransferase n=1 Tax=marine sediment metagenome TaxID=412755 RepID=A0A0F9FFA5_9ZZZZ